MHEYERLEFYPTHDTRNYDRERALWCVMQGNHDTDRINELSHSILVDQFISLTHYNRPADCRTDAPNIRW